MRILHSSYPRFAAILVATLALAAVLAPSGSTAPSAQTRAVVGFRSQAALAAALQRFPGAQVVRRVPHLKTAEVSLAGDPALLASLPGITFAHRPLMRTPQVEPALAAMFRPGLPYEWQYVATRENEVPEAVLRAAGAFKIALIDTGTDVTHPDIAAKNPETWDIAHHIPSVHDKDGHGTFTSALAAGSVTNGEGIAGFGGDTKLLMIRAVSGDDMFSDVDEAAAIVYAVDHGANVISMSIGGEGTSGLEQRAVQYAASHNVLMVAAAGNEFQQGNPVEYPAAALQPPGSKGQGGVGLSVGASTMASHRAYFSNTGSYLSLLAPGDSVFSAVAAGSDPRDWPRYALPGSVAGLYGWSSGTSFSTPEVAGAAVLVWAANPSLTATQVAGILKATATGRGSWNAGMGYGIIDVAAAVAAATGQHIAPRTQAGAWLSMRRLRLRYLHYARVSPRLRRVDIAVHLRSSSPTVTPDYRVVSLEIRRGRHWRRLARRSTRLGGGVRWTIGLRPGRHLLRVSYSGRWDLRPAVRLKRIRVS